jgi:single-stranded-DNA-specific exonuclease
MHDVYQMKDFKESIIKVWSAIESKQRIVLFADHDVDGIMSAIIVKEGLELLGVKPFVYFSNVAKYGYGLSLKALDILKKEAPGLLITLDLGVGNTKELVLAQKMGFEPLIIDHHKVLEKIPKGCLVINPFQKGDNLEFKELATGGLAYLFVKSLLFQVQKRFFPENFLELAMIATLADMVPLEQDNLEIVEQGMISLPHTKRKGLRALMQVTEFGDCNYQEIGQKIISPLSSARSEDHKPDLAFELLTETSLVRARKKAKKLLQMKEEKKRLINMILDQIKEKGDLSLPIVFEGSKDWPASHVGLVASKVLQEYKKPTFIYHKGTKICNGSVRTPKGMDSVDLMSHCKRLLLNYGGHPRASGFGIKTENLERFKNCLVKSLNQGKID